MQGDEKGSSPIKLDTSKEMTGMWVKAFKALSREVLAREKEAKEERFHSMHLNTREDLKLPLETEEGDAAARILEQMKHVEKRQIHLHDTKDRN